MNFEDLGEGASFANLVINELYDQPRIEGDNILWGRNHFFVRDEFSDANPNQSMENVDNLLLVFGGVDQHDLSKKIYHSIIINFMIATHPRLNQSKINIIRKLLLQ